MDGVENGGKVVKVKVANSRTVRCSVFFLRSLAVVTTLVAATVMGIAKETEIIPVTLLPSLPPLNIAVTAKSKYLSSGVFFVVSNAIACAYAALSLIIALANQGRSHGLELMLIILDVMTVALLFSSVGAAAAIGVIGYKGNAHAQWHKTCDKFERFCIQTTSSIGVSFIGSLIFIILIVIAISNLQKRSA